MDDAINNDMFCADIPLTKDACASLLVKWVRFQENDADTLVERFPRIKPGITVLFHPVPNIQDIV
jgi:hypothetical protein